MSEPVIETYWIEIPCKDEESARKLAKTLEGFKPIISVHKLVRGDMDDVGALRMEYEILEGCS